MHDRRWTSKTTARRLQLLENHRLPTLRYLPGGWMCQTVRGQNSQDLTTKTRRRRGRHNLDMQIRIEDTK